MRLDISLQKMGLTYSRQKAKELIKQGHISVNGSICFKPSYLIKDGDDIKIIGETLKYVGRGGLKLEKIIDICRVDLNNNLYGYRSLYRRIYRLYAAKRRVVGLFC